MNPLLNYPFDIAILRRKKNSIRRELLEQPDLVEKRIAVLGGSTTNEIVQFLELFLLNQGIRPIFYESDYGKYWEDAMFGNETLKAFHPDTIFIHTSLRNISQFPKMSDDPAAIESSCKSIFEHFKAMWEQLIATYSCPIIQNNFEYPFFRVMGNQDAVDPHGRVNFVSRLNNAFADFAAGHDYLYINDINYQSADYGLKEWSDPRWWYLYKYALCPDAIPTLAFNVAGIIKSIFGKNRKALALDLDNTLWGGIVGDDGADNLEIGSETASGEAYSEFQQYLKLLRDRGVLLNVISKNDSENAEKGLSHPQMILKREDFVSVIANWNPKSDNLIRLSNELSLLPESFVFMDDNPAEREIIRQQLPNVSVPEIHEIEDFISTIDHSGFFEMTAFSADDLKRNDMYRENKKRQELQEQFTDYSEYLRSLQMTAHIGSFEPVYFARIAQLTNKTNQFNLTTRRFSQEEIEAIAADSNYMTLYGSLHDRFGDNGIVSVIIGEKQDNELQIILWLMSCRVLKRDMEFAMMDAIAAFCRKNDIKVIKGEYRPTSKNAMVREHYGQMGFTKESEDETGCSHWRLAVQDYQENKNDVITVNGGTDGSN